MVVTQMRLSGASEARLAASARVFLEPLTAPFWNLSYSFIVW